MAMTHDEMATELRKAGWACAPPSNSDTLPDPARGQLWIAPNKKIAPRLIATIGQRGGWPFVGYIMRDGGPGGEIGQSAFRAWARKTGARPEPTP